MVARGPVKNAKPASPHLPGRAGGATEGYSVGDMETRSPTYFADLLAETAIPARGILSQTLSKADGVELVLFAFAAGEALTEHTSARPAIMHVLTGEGELTVGGEPHPARPGTWVRMPARHEAQHHGANAARAGALPAAGASSRRLTRAAARRCDRVLVVGSGGRIRTTDQGLMSPLLYH